VTVYVDDMRARFGRMIMCHMIADSDDELHAMADAIGVARKWHQDKGSGSHYDIALSKRVLAVGKGAVEITLRQCAKMNWVRLFTGALPSPATVEATWRSLRERQAAERAEAAP
jgi:hypothetical protein